MHKEKSALTICLLILLADAICVRQIFNLWFSEKLFFISLPGIAIATSLGILTIVILRISFLLLGRIVAKQTASKRRSVSRSHARRRLVS